MTRSVQNFIDGKAVDAADGRRSRPGRSVHRRGVRLGAGVRSPRTSTAPTAAAAKAFETWRDTTPSERQRALLKFADAMEERAEEIIAAECENTGKPIELTRTEEIPPAVDQIRFFAGAARLLEGRSAGEYMAGYTSYVRREPVGVVGQVTPWNYPMMMAVWKIAPALAAGNCVVLKPSDTTPVSTALMAEIAAEFLPPGVFNVVCGDRDTGRAIVSHPTPAMVSITGSTRAGYEVADRRGQGPQAHAPRARRQGAGHRLRRRRYRRRRREHRDRRLLQRRAGLHRRHPRAGRPADRRRLRRRAGRAGPQHQDRRAGRRRHPLRPAEQRQPARTGRRDARPAARPRAGAAPAARARASAATSGSRPSSATCSRTTR